MSTPRKSSPDLVGKTLTWLGDAPRRAWVRSRRLTGADVASLATPAVRVAQDGSPGPATCYHVVVIEEGGGRLRAPHLDAPFHAGDVLVLDDTTPCEALNPAGARVLQWRFPAGRIGPYLPACARLPLLLRGSLAHLLAGHARGLAALGREVPRASQAPLVDHLASLVGIAVAARTAALPARPAPRLALRRRILAYLGSHVREPDLSVRRVAADLGISERWLHAVLRDAGLRFREVVVEQRLVESRHILADPAAARLSVAEIAFACGFDDLSTFYRRFRGRYGETPGAVRARAQAGTD